VKPAAPDNYTIDSTGYTPQTVATRACNAKGKRCFDENTRRETNPVVKVSPFWKRFTNGIKMIGTKQIELPAWLPLLPFRLDI
jgi:hypothetical protein